MRTLIEEASSRKDRTRKQSLEWLMSVATDATGHAQAPFAAAAASRSPESTTRKPNTDYERAMALLEIDRRVTAMTMRTHFNPVDRAVVSDWQNILDGYRQVLEAGPPTAPLYTIESVRRRLAQSLESLGRAHVALHDDEEAAAAYQQAARAYDSAGEPVEASRCRSTVRQHKLVDEAEYDQQIRAAFQDMEDLDQTQPEYFSRLVELGELQVQAGDDFAAEKTLRKAQAGLDATKCGNPGGGDLAEALLATLGGISSGDAISPLIDIRTRLQVRGLHRRIHLSLADIYQRAGNMSRADEQLRLAKTMDQSSPNDDFSTTMRTKLASDWKHLLG
jgi:tetratricopeptide (TPR) repeat protein